MQRSDYLVQKNRWMPRKAPTITANRASSAFILLLVPLVALNMFRLQHKTLNTVVGSNFESERSGGCLEMRA